MVFFFSSPCTKKNLIMIVQIADTKIIRYDVIGGRGGFQNRIKLWICVHFSGNFHCEYPISAKDMSVDIRQAPNLVESEENSIRGSCGVRSYYTVQHILKKCCAYDKETKILYIL